ncbi:hypothetical protein [Thermoanaerobacterium sp. RBIITD]|uniref:hypothetical protein n=1 Tax=Thermoanaerobacterium sp. RBIITD TaxID=1550240 RepID=UPI000BB79895|nr:hypothetical protein [Thermoanaerobacterium sp. RBIITD]SNX53026.1 hypothetical protein SAMN05660242_0515 [Thermoanaerobacterium sp. RBIITD]
MLFIITLMALILILVPAVLERDNSGYTEFMKSEFGYKDVDDSATNNNEFNEFAFSYKLR